MTVRSHLNWAQNRAWAEKLAGDADRAARFLDGPHAEINRAVLHRAKSLGADAVVLTGSTARGKRTSISDLDYLIIGSKPRVADLQEDVDVHTSSPARFHDRIVSGDSFTHWALDHGCVLWDAGVVREGLLAKLEDGHAPDPSRLWNQYKRLREFAADVVASGDIDAAHRETLAALSLGARWWLLIHGVSPLARSELPSQLIEAGNDELAFALRTMIIGKPSLESQSHWLARSVGDTRVTESD